MDELHITQFDLYDTLESGQTFCWTKEGKGYVNTDIGQAVYVEQKGDRLLFEYSESRPSLEQLRYTRR